MQVLTDDGVALHVEVDELEGAELTVLFSHGFTAQLGEFELQRAALAGRARLVLYDQRGHGRSGRSGWRGATIDQLGRDLQAVLDATTPAGPVVLFGHSMGGMTLMSWARQHPGQVGSRVVGAFLLATSAGDLVQTGPIAAGVQLLTRLHLLPVLFAWLRLISPLIERVRKPGTRVGRAYIRHYLFGTDDAGDPELVTRVAAMLEATPFTTTALFYPTFITHDERDSLSVLRRIPTTVLCGSSDRLTPVAHSRAWRRRWATAPSSWWCPGRGTASTSRASTSWTTPCCGCWTGRSPGRTSRPADGQVSPQGGSGVGMTESLTFIGTATTLLRYGGFTILTDPNFLHRGQRAYLGHGLWSPRLTEPAMGVADLPVLDAVVLSHLHGDHFDRVARKGLDHALPIITTRHAARRLRSRGFPNAVALETWRTHELRKGDDVLRVTSMPGRHARGALQAALPPVMGSVVEFVPADAAPLTVYITGDTLLIEDLLEVPRRYPDLDLGLWHLGGTRILGMLVTMDATQGADLLEAVRPRVTVPIHNDDYGVFHSPLQDFLDEVQRRGLSGVRPLARGESLSLGP